MNRMNHDPGGRHHSPGVCHRCGWKGNVLRIRRKDRRVLGSGRDYGRLCDDCYRDILAGRAGDTAKGGAPPARLKAFRGRHVA